MGEEYLSKSNYAKHVLDTTLPKLLQQGGSLIHPHNYVLTGTVLVLTCFVHLNGVALYFSGLG